MSAFLLTWNPKKSPWPEITSKADAVRRGEKVTQDWSLGSRKYVEAGDTVYWARVGDEPKGIFARGVILREALEAAHWDEERAAKGDKTTYAFVQITDLRVPGQERIIDSQVIEQYEALAQQNWTPESSGTRIDDQATALLDSSFDALVEEGTRPSYHQFSLLSRYSRKDVAGVFDPDYKFNPNFGKWSPSGIVSPEGSADTVFFVTLGQSQGEHTFVEGISKEGILVWQSQPNQKLAHPAIRRLIDHDEKAYSIFLFLRASGKDNYTYCGRLAYEDHISDQEQPVHFTWRLLDWVDVKSQIFDAIGMRPLTVNDPSGEREADSDQDTSSEARANVTVRSGLQRTDPPDSSARSGTSKRSFVPRSSAGRAAQDASNKKLGLAGEKAVLELEKSRLTEAGREDLALRVRHVSVEDGDGAGYDILSFDEEGHERHIEVKTTKGGLSTKFYISPNELDYSREHTGTFVLVRVYDFEPRSESGSLYELRGDMYKALSLEPSAYRAWPS